MRQLHQVKEGRNGDRGHNEHRHERNSPPPIVKGERESRDAAAKGDFEDDRQNQRQTGRQFAVIRRQEAAPIVDDVFGDSQRDRDGARRYRYHLKQRQFPEGMNRLTI